MHDSARQGFCDYFILQNNSVTGLCQWFILPILSVTGLCQCVVWACHITGGTDIFSVSPFIGSLCTDIIGMRLFICFFMDDRISFMNDPLYNWHNHFIYVIIGYVYVIIKFFFTDCSQFRNEWSRFSVCLCLIKTNVPVYRAKKRVTFFFCEKLAFFLPHSFPCLP